MQRCFFAASIVFTAGAKYSRACSNIGSGLFLKFHNYFLQNVHSIFLQKSSHRQLVYQVFPKLAVYNSVDPSLAPSLLMVISNSSVSEILLQFLISLWYINLQKHYPYSLVFENFHAGDH